jgi:trk system potassium uptake protein TrkA
MTLREANLTNLYKVIVLTTVKITETKKDGVTKEQKEASGIAASETIMEEGDILVVFGELSNINKLIQKGE